jgi:hypothetical protein
MHTKKISGILLKKINVKKEKIILDDLGLSR